MTDSIAERLIHALLDPLPSPDAAHGDRGIHAFASLLQEAQALDLPSCPDRARRRAHGLADALAPEASRGWRGWVARLVFDSWGAAVPAARSLGSDRLLRFEGPLASLDVQVGRDEVAEQVVVAVAVEGGGEVEGLEVFVDGQEQPIPLDEDGAGSVRLDADARTLVFEVRDAHGVVLRTPEVEVS